MINLYSFLEGNNLCNIFASLIVEELDKTNKNPISEISVVNLGFFFVVKGFTTGSEKISLNEILSNFLTPYYDVPPSTKVFDFIDYSQVKDNKDFTVSLVFDKEKESIKEKNKKLIDEFFNDSKCSLTLKIDDQNKYLEYDSNNKISPKLHDFLELNFFNYSKNYKKDYQTFFSDRYYGLSECLEKDSIKLLKNISYLLSITNIISFLDCNIHYDSKNGLKFYLNKTKSIVDKKWLESLILDVFPVEDEKTLGKYFSRDSSHLDIIKNNYTPSWKQKKNLGDLILF
jgi:hypothetical protein